MTKYQRLIDSLELTKKGEMKVFGQSMKPRIESGSHLYFEKQDDYEIDDVVFSKVRGRFIDAHKIIKKDTNKGFLIANNHGYENGWTKTIYGKAVAGEINNKRFKL